MSINKSYMQQTSVYFGINPFDWRLSWGWEKTGQKRWHGHLWIGPIECYCNLTRFW